MKILCISDYVDPLIYNQEVKNNFADVDLVLCAGDLPMDYVDFVVTVLSKPTYFIFGNHNLKDFHLYHKSARNMPGTVQTDYNNPAYYHGGNYLGFKTVKDFSLVVEDPITGKKRPLLLAGVSGSLKYNNGLNQYTDKQMKFHLMMMLPKLIRNKIKYGTYLDIFLTHASPRHIHDHEDPCHKGFDCFNWFIEKFKPTYLVHGHIHLYDMREERAGVYGGTTVVNAYAHCVIEFPPKTSTETNITDTNKITI
ncbi:MAG: metallophosphoesterase [Treponema sp.]|nr:metallophosphoesterase [Treponema sp.]